MRSIYTYLTLVLSILLLTSCATPSLPSTPDEILTQIKTREKVGADGSFYNSLNGPYLNGGYRAEYMIRSIGENRMQIYAVQRQIRDNWPFFDRAANRLGIVMEFNRIHGDVDVLTSSIIYEEHIGLTMSTSDAQKICDTIPGYGPFPITVAGRGVSFVLNINVNYIRAMLTKMGK